MSTQIILTSDVEALGLEGDAVRVAEGYARNYLIPQGLAIPATAANLRRIETLRQKREEEQAAKRKESEALAKHRPELVFYPMPAQQVLRRDHPNWWRSANL